MLNQNLNTELKVGIFSACGLAVIAIMVVTLDGNPFSAKKQVFYTVLDNVGGVGPRTQVRTSGVQIGEVSSIDILPKGARVNFRVDPKVAVPKGSFIELRSRGILGDVYLEIVRNEKNPDAMKTGDMIPKVKEMNDLGELMSSLGSIATDIKTVTSTLSSVFGNKDGRSSLQNILNNVEQITADTRDLLSGQKSNILRMVQTMSNITDKINALIERNDGRLDDILSSVASASADFKVFSSELRKVSTTKNRQTIENILATLDDSMKNIRTTTSKVQLIVDKVERGEGSLGQLVSKNDTADDIKATLKSVQEILKPATRLKIEIDYKGELRNSNTAVIASAGNHFNVRLSTRPDRYYLFGLSDSPQTQKVTRTQRVTTVNGNSETVDEEQTSPEDRERLRFNAQFAKRFDALGVRFGLFESYAGIAGDLYFFSDKFQAAVEVFNFGSGNLKNTTSDGRGFARVKTYGNIFVTPNIYLTGGADNIGKTPRPLAFLGAGLRFTDDDLKAIMGAAALAK